MKRLQQLFTVANGGLVWAAARRGVTKGKVVTGEQVRIDGTLYTTRRVLYKLVHGVDPKSATVADDLTARDYRAVGLAIERVRETVDNRFDGCVDINGKTITVGTYSTRLKAQEAASIFLRSINRGL